MDMRQEFKESFGSYVCDRTDLRKSMLQEVLNSSLFEIVKDRSTIQTKLDVLIHIFEGRSYVNVFFDVFPLPQDLAALMTCAVSVDPSSPACKALIASYKEYQMGDLETEFNPQFMNLEIFLDSSVPGLQSFLETLYKVPVGKVYLCRMFVCLIWAHKIPQMIPNLWKPTTKSGGIRCLLSS